MKIKPLMLIPPVLFAGLAALFYIGAIFLFPGALSAFTLWVVSTATT